MVDLEDLNSLGAELIENEGTLVETVIRETGCEGVQVSFRSKSFMIYQSNEYIYPGQFESL